VLHHLNNKSKLEDAPNQARLISQPEEELKVPLVWNDGFKNPNAEKSSEKASASPSSDSEHNDKKRKEVKDKDKVMNEHHLKAGTNKKEIIMSFVDLLNYIKLRDSAGNRKPESRKSKKSSNKSSSKKSDQEEEVKRPASDPS